MTKVTRHFLGGWKKLAATLTLGLVAVVQPLCAASVEESLPKNTLVFARIANAKALTEAFYQTQFGLLIQDPALKPIRDEVNKGLTEFSNDVKTNSGMTLSELFDLPTGEMVFAVVPSSNEKIPAGYYASVDAGKNQAAFQEAMEKLVKFGTSKGSKVAKETFNGVELSVITSEIKNDEGETTKTTFAVARTGSVFHVSESADTLKSVLKGNASNSLASLDDYKKAKTKFRDGSQIQYFVNVPAVINIGVKAAAANADNAQIDAQQVETIINMLGIGGVKGLLGSVTLNDAQFDFVSTTTVLLTKPVEGILKVFKLKSARMEPESWVPASVASYQSFGWDLDTAYTAINELTNLFQPGLLNVLEQQLVGPNGGDPLSFQKDLFGPLGSRVTVISDFAKPIKEDSQRSLFAVSLDDSAAFSKTLAKLFDLAGVEPKKREFQGTTIFDIQPEIPAGAGIDGVNVDSGPLSIAIAKDTLFITGNPTLLESVLRGGFAKLADSADYKAVAKNFPSSTTSITFSNMQESSRAIYEMLKQGSIEKAVDAAAGQAGDKAPNVDVPFDTKNLPDYSVFAKYLSNGGGYSVVDDDGVTSTQFLLRKNNP